MHSNDARHPATAAASSNIGTFPGTTVQNPGVQGDNTSFYQDTLRETKQTAFFASVDFDLIPKVLTLTAGTRHFLLRQLLSGQRLVELRLLRGGHAAPAAATIRLYSYNLNAAESARHRVRLQEPRQPDLARHAGRHGVLHVLAGLPAGRLQPERRFAACLRPGWRCRSTSIPTLVLIRQADQQRDRLEDRILRPSPAVERRRVPGELGQRAGRVLRSRRGRQIFYNTNGQNFLIKGIETSLVARVVSGLTLQGAASWNQSEQTNSPALIDNNPASANYGKPITQACSSSGTELHAGHQSVRPDRRPERRCAADAVQPARPLRVDHRPDYTPFVQVGATHTGHSFTQAGSNPTIRRSRRRQYRAVAVRESRLLDLRCLGRRRQGCLDRATVRREPRATRTPARSSAPISSSSRRRRCGRGCLDLRSATSSEGCGSSARRTGRPCSGR